MSDSAKRIARKPIYIAGLAIMSLTSGRKVVAIQPVAKGQKHSYLLLDNDKLTTLKEQRVNGVGIERYVQTLGFQPAAQDDSAAIRLADLIAVHEGRKLVEDASVEHGSTLQKRFAGQTCTYVPFDPAKPVQKALVKPYSGFTTAVVDLGSICSGNVALEYTTALSEAGYLTSGMHLNEGWLLGPDEDPAAAPRSTEYGGLIEHAAFIVANSGLATVSTPLLTGDAEFPRGRMDLRLTNCDQTIVVADDAGDELVVQLRDASGKVVCSHHGLESDSSGRLSLAMAVGCIASVLVKDQILAEQAWKKQARRKSAA